MKLRIPARWRFLLPIALGLMASTAKAQTAVSVRIVTEPTSIRYTVDGQMYYGPTTFLWPPGSKHVVGIITDNSSAAGGNSCGSAGVGSVLQYENGCAARYGFEGWETENGKLPGTGSLTQTFTADGSFSLLRAKFKIQYRVDVAISEALAGGASGQCVLKANNPSDLRRVGDSIGIVFIGTHCFDYSGHVWLDQGEYDLQAMALNGYVFDGWLLNGAAAGSLAKMTIRGPTVIVPRFLPAKRVRIFTNPPELLVRVDRAVGKTLNPSTNVDTFPSPGSFDWLPGSKHILGAPSPQNHPLGLGLWVFASWSSGGGQDMVYTPDNEVNRIATLTANFVRGVSVTFLTEPRGLKLKVDGRDNWPGYQFVWGLGSKYSVSAPLEQVDTKSRKWVFKGWQHGGAAAQEIAIDQADIDSGGVYYTARYEALPQVVLRTSVPGQTIRVDGALCQSPCVLDRDPGTQIQVSVSETIVGNAVSRHDFVRWSDGAPATRTVIFDRETQEITATYQAANRLLAVVDPREGASVIFDPPPADGFYPEHVAVTITIQPKIGYRFRRWEGDLSGTVAYGVVLMNTPRSVQAMLTRVPQLSPASVVNAAGATPADGVAAGSLISIFGGSLANSYEAGPASPLAQTIGGVTATIGDRLLPLMFVSPEQINALLPSDLAPGSYTLRVRPPGMPEVASEVNVVRHAPGLLHAATDQGKIALAQRQDGSPVTIDQPAKAGDLLTVLGTGFGPYDRPIVDGFAIPLSPRYTLVDPVEIRLGDATLPVQWAGAAPGLSGVTAVRLRVPEAIRGVRELTASVGGTSSNTVLLPLE